jgi:acetyltransferase-like isoleucine patch superfamily enzyme
VGPAATILKGVTIGDHVEIEAGSVVAVDVPDGSRAAGNPARVVGRA